MKHIKKYSFYLLFVFSLVCIWRSLLMMTDDPFPGSTKWRTFYTDILNISLVYYRETDNQCNNFDDFKNVVYENCAKHGFAYSVVRVFSERENYGYMEKIPTCFNSKDVPMLWGTEPRPEGKIAVLFFDMELRAVDVNDFSNMLERFKKICNKEGIHIDNGVMKQYKDTRWFFRLLFYLAIPLFTISIAGMVFFTFFSKEKK